MITITVVSGSARARLREIAEKVGKPEEMALIVGRELRNRLVDHFLGKDRDEPNKLGGDRTHFWRAVADSVQQPQIDQGGTEIRVAINHPVFRQKLYGGPISAVRAKALTIPIDAESYGRTAPTFERETGLNLFVYSPKGPSAGIGYLAANIDAHVKVFYLLRPRVRRTV